METDKPITNKPIVGLCPNPKCGKPVTIPIVWRSEAVNYSDKYCRIIEMLCPKCHTILGIGTEPLTQDELLIIKEGKQRIIS
jgi:hypothetical protein